jgi:hypothetical protein
LESALKSALLESALLAQEKYVGIVGVGIIAPTPLFNPFCNNFSTMNKSEQN